MCPAHNHNRRIQPKCKDGYSDNASGDTTIEHQGRKYTDNNLRHQRFADHAIVCR
jgi:hypothetical protein